MSSYPSENNFSRAKRNSPVEGEEDFKFFVLSKREIMSSSFRSNSLFSFPSIITWSETCSYRKA